MLEMYTRLRDLDFSMLMDLYAEGNEENAKDLYPNESLQSGILMAQQDFYRYLADDFFRQEGAVYCVWRVDGIYVSALRLEPYRDGLLLEALETHPLYRRKGYAAELVGTVISELTANSPTRVYSHVSKGNVASLKTHHKCGFVRVAEHAAYIDGSVSQSACTLCLQVPSAE